MQRLNRLLPSFTRWAAIVLGLWHLALVGGLITLSTMEIRIVHLTVILFLVFLALPQRMRSDEAGTPQDTSGDALALAARLAAAAAALATGWYLYSRWQDIALSGGLTTDLDAYVGLVVIALVLLAVIRSIGYFLAIIVALFLAYPLVSAHLPGLLNSRGYGLERLSVFLTNSSEGVYGIPLGVSASYIIMFTIFGAFLNTFGAGDFFFRISSRLMRSTRAASAKTAVVFSTLIGMISGSAAGNVAVTGTMTIPMLKREGYKPHQAGAVEAVVSTGGQMMPPIMGAAAFIMAEIIGRPYADVMAASVIPALLFFLSIFLVVHLQAVKADMRRSEPEGSEVPLWRILLPGLRFMVPFAILVAMMVAGYSPFRASFLALGVLLAGCLAWEFRDPKGFVAKILDALESGTKSVLSIAVACAGAGIIAGILAVTGLGSKISGLIVTASAGVPVVALGLTMLTALVLGMGLPTTAAYLILATVVAPALVSMGVPLLTAHLFVFFYGCVSTITPPVALASYVAASIAQSDINRTSWTAFVYGITSYILPFMFFFSPALLMQGDWIDIARSSLTGAASVFCIAVAIVGFLLRPIGWALRIGAAAAGLLLLYQSVLTDVAGLALLAGIALPGLARRRGTGVRTSKGTEPELPAAATVRSGPERPE